MAVARFPLSEIFSIRTTPPEPTAAMKALEDWRLVYAPEPVLPEAGGGGETSPMLGKVPKPFKLALLGGGDFDLAEGKRKDRRPRLLGHLVRSVHQVTSRALSETISAFPSDRVEAHRSAQLRPSFALNK